MSTRHAWLGALLAAVGVGGTMAVVAAPEDGRVIGIWPVGLAAIAVLVAGRRLRLAVVGTILVLAVLTIWLGGRPFEVAMGYGIGIAVESWLVWRLLAKGGEARPRLQEDADLRRFVVATFAGSAVGAASGALTSAVTGWGSPGMIALALGTAHLGALVTVLPFACQLPDHPAVATQGERILQWGLMAVITPLVFWPIDVPSLPFLLIPLLAWGALRVQAVEALAQQVLVLGCAIVLTTLDRGPFASVPQALGIEVDARGILLAAFAVTTGLIVLPLTLRVGEQVATAREARAERDRLATSSTAPPASRSSEPTPRAGSPCSTPARNGCSATTARRCSAGRPATCTLPRPSPRRPRSWAADDFGIVARGWPPAAGGRPRSASGARTASSAATR